MYLQLHPPTQRSCYTVVPLHTLFTMYHPLLYLKMNIRALYGLLLIFGLYTGRITAAACDDSWNGSFSSRNTLGTGRLCLLDYLRVVLSLWIICCVLYSMVVCVRMEVSCLVSLVEILRLRLLELVVFLTKGAVWAQGLVCLWDRSTDLPVALDIVPPDTLTTGRDCESIVTQKS